MKNTKFISAVMCLPINRRGQFLITKRHDPANPKWNNKWQVAGGAIEFGETPEQALARETQEELGVSIRILFPYPIVKTKSYLPGEDEDTPSRPVHITFACYIVDIADQKIDVSHDDETADWQWIYPSEIHQFKCLSLTQEFIEEAETIIKQYKLLK